MLQLNSKRLNKHKNSIRETTKKRYQLFTQRFEVSG